MIVCEKIRTIENKIAQSKPQDDLDRQTGKTLAISSGNVCKHEFLTHKDALSDLFEK